MIHLIGPGGAGKTTVGAALAERLGVRFVDQDAQFTTRHGDISTYIAEHGYAAYASRNVGVFLDLAGGPDAPDIVALSSGFMTYPDDVHPDYRVWKQHIAASALTFVLLPSLDVESCVAETVRRQRARPFARSADREEQVIRARLPIFLALPAVKIETMQPVETVVTELMSSATARWQGPLTPAARAPGD